AVAIGIGQNGLKARPMRGFPAVLTEGTWEHGLGEWQPFKRILVLGAFGSRSPNGALTRPVALRTPIRRHPTDAKDPVARRCGSLSISRTLSPCAALGWIVSRPAAP